jgi:sarcosine oxidase subunit alpha
MERAENHPILEFHKGRKVDFFFEGQRLTGCEGETIAAALHASGVRYLHESARKHRPRGLFCAIGNCSSCLMKVDGLPNVRVCVEPLREGMTIERQKGNEKARLTPDTEEKRGGQGRIIDVEVLVIGGGPAGLCAAIEAADAGAGVLLVERDPRLGGQLVKQTHKFFGSEKQDAGSRGVDIAVKLGREIAARENIEVWLSSAAAGYYKNGVVMVDRDGIVEGVRAGAVIVATGASEKNLVFPNNDLPGIYGAGAVQTLMNVEGVLPGKNVLMVGAGNIGLIVSYQLMQAGVNVAAVIEAAPCVGGYEVHANKLRRAGVPILTSHTIRCACGKDRVEGAVIHALDERFCPIPKTEKTLQVDVICMAVGLSPLLEFFFQAGCDMKYVPELGGYVPIIDPHRHTSVGHIYAAGDSGGVEEASSAMLTGKLAGISAARDLGYAQGYEAKYRDYTEQLESLRPQGGKICSGLLKTREGAPVRYER